MPLLATAGGASVRGLRPYSSQAVAAFIAATGGTVTTSGNYKYHTFYDSATFEVTSSPAGKYIDVLLVGGGGATGGNSSCGGGGGVVIKENESVSVGSYTITVGRVNANSFGDGGPSQAFGFVALGGGGGGGGSDCLLFSFGCLDTPCKEKREENEGRNRAGVASRGFL